MVVVVVVAAAAAVVLVVVVVFAVSWGISAASLRAAPLLDYWAARAH